MGLLRRPGPALAAAEHGADDCFTTCAEAQPATWIAQASRATSLRRSPGTSPRACTGDTTSRATTISGPRCGGRSSASTPCRPRARSNDSIGQRSRWPTVGFARPTTSQLSPARRARYVILENDARALATARCYGWRRDRCPDRDDRLLALRRPLSL